MPRIPQAFALRDRVYFDLFEESGANMLRATRLLAELLREWPDERGMADQIRECEQEGDRITHAVIDRLNQAVTPSIDREDILRLTSAIDDIVDYTEEVADYLGLYRIEAPMDQAIQLSAVLRDAAEEIAKAIPKLRGFNSLTEHTVEVNRLENEGDRITRDAIASLFDGGIDPMVVIRWKDLFERLEEAVDATEHVANMLQGIVIKHS